jgi:pentatricopeptide repeat protein
MEIVTCHGWLHGRNEKTSAIQLKNLIRRSNVEAAEQLLTLLEQEATAAVAQDGKSQKERERSRGKVGSKTQDLALRLRTFLPLFEYYCENGDVKAMMKLYHRMQEAPGVHFDVEAYTLLLASLARHGYFKPDSNYGPELFDQLVTTMAADILELTPETADELEAGFQDGYSTTTAIVDSSNATAAAVVFERVQIPSNRTCPKTSTELRLISLDETQRQHVHDTLLEMAELARQEFAAKIKNQRSGKKDKVTQAENTETPATKDPAYQALLDFSEWLE